MIIRDFFQTKFLNWNDLEKKIEVIDSLKEKGDVFEHFVYFYLSYFKDLYQIEEIYCPVVEGRPFPQHVIEKLKLEITDYGVDGVYINSQGEYIAWQAKFRSGRVSPTYSELATFWAEAENADYRLIVANSLFLPKVSKKKQGHLSILFDHFSKLNSEFFEGLFRFYTSRDGKEITFVKKTPRDYQEEIITNIKNGFASSKKGKLIAACGIGKTLVSLWVSEQMNCQNVVFFAPSLQLIRQTLEQWTIESNIPFKYLCVCSDQSISSDVDSNNIDVEDLDIPVTTNADLITKFLNHSPEGKKVIFCTYQSSSVLHEALIKGSFHAFDIAIYDEAHRTAGVSLTNLFSSAVSDNIVPAKLKLFMTATERLVRPRLGKMAQDDGLEVFSMDNEEFYGETFHKLTFGEAIEKNIISDYRIVFTGVTKQEIGSLIEKNLLVKDESDEKEIEAGITVYKRNILEKSIAELGLRKVITFHSKIPEAQRMARDLSLPIDDSLLSHYVSHINGSMTAQQRSYIIDEFESADLGVLTNVRCLTEGIDIPLIDAVFFADPKGSLVDIIQAVGRALRQPYGAKGKIAYIIIPLLLDSADGDILSGQGFEALFNLIQALRDQDESLAEWIDTINLSAAKGRGNSAGNLGKLIINLPKEVKYEEFAESLVLRIAEVNKNATGTIGVGSKLGKNERRGSFTRVFKTMCDYTPEMLEESLVIPTFLKIQNSTVEYSGRDLKVNNNNVSHCSRLGLIKKNDEGNYLVTDLGKKYMESPKRFKDIMKNQMLLFGYNEEGGLYPYRLAFEFMKSLREMNFIQFIYGLYSVQFDANGNPDIDSAVNIAKLIQSEYPNIELTNETNKPTILEQLNKFHPVGFSYQNVWTDRTTTGNQYRYIIRHLELFDEIFEFEKGKLRLLEGAEEIIENILMKTQPLLDENKYGYNWWLEKSAVSEAI